MIASRALQATSTKDKDQVCKSQKAKADTTTTLKTIVTATITSAGSLFRAAMLKGRSHPRAWQEIDSSEVAKAATSANKHESRKRHKVRNIPSLSI